MAMLLYYWNTYKIYKKTKKDEEELKEQLKIVY